MIDLIKIYVLYLFTAKLILGRVWMPSEQERLFHEIHQRSMMAAVSSATRIKLKLLQFPRNGNYFSFLWCDGTKCSQLCDFQIETDKIVIPWCKIKKSILKDQCKEMSSGTSAGNSGACLPVKRFRHSVDITSLILPGEPKNQYFYVSGMSYYLSFAYHTVFMAEFIFSRFNSQFKDSSGSRICG